MCLLLLLPLLNHTFVQPCFCSVWVNTCWCCLRFGLRNVFWHRIPLLFCLLDTVSLFSLKSTLPLKAHALYLRWEALNTPWLPPSPSITCHTKADRDQEAGSSLFQGRFGLAYSLAKLPVRLGKGETPRSSLLWPTLLHAAGADWATSLKPPCESRELGAWPPGAGARPVTTAGHRAVFPEKAECSAAFWPLWAAWPRGPRHVGAAGSGGGLATGSSQQARAGAAGAHGQPGQAERQPGTAGQPLRVGSRPGMRARTAGRRRSERDGRREGRDGAGTGGGRRRPCRGGAPERAASPLTSGASSSSLGLHHFLRDRPPPPRSGWRCGEPWRAGPEAGGSSRAGRGSADRKSGRRKAGMADVGKQKDGRGDSKQSGEVSVGAKAAEARASRLPALGKAAAGWGQPAPVLRHRGPGAACPGLREDLESSDHRFQVLR